MREIIKPIKRKPYDEIRDTRDRAIFILLKCGISKQKVAYLFKISPRNIFYIQQRIFEKYPTVE